MIPNTGPVPADQLDKIIVGFNLALDRYVLRFRRDLKDHSATVPKRNDIIFRGSIAEGNWSYHLRKGIMPILKRLENSYQVILPTKRVTLREYCHEMMSSRICISPFGYGEICWRDFEAIMCGCLLIKPDMGHAITNPNIYSPYKTYVPVKWDYSDLEEKCVYYLTHEDQRERLIAQASEVLEEFYNNDGFIKSVSEILSSLDIELTSRKVGTHCQS
jgi:hypothetical protein